jgi:protein gp37
VKVFAEDLGDLFEDRPDLVQHRDRFWPLIGQTPNIDWLLCTKRIENVRRMVPAAWLHSWPTNVWLGITVENQHYADSRIPQIIEIPAQIRFLSVEPMLGPIDLGPWLRDIHWVLVGGESAGPGEKADDVRLMDISGVRRLRDQCVAARVAFFLKQWGDRVPGPVRKLQVLGQQAKIPVLDGRCWAEFPDTTPVTGPTTPTEPPTTPTVNTDREAGQQAAVTSSGDDAWPVVRTDPPSRTPFPLNALSESHRDYVESIAATHNVPADLPATMSLGVLAAATAKKCVVSTGYQNISPITLWVLGVLRSGEGKTPAIRELTSTIEQTEARLVADSKAAIAQADTRKRVLARRAAHIEGQAARTSDDLRREELMLQAQDVRVELSTLEATAEPRLICEDCTTEALVQRLAEQRGRIALISDEGSVLFGGLRRRSIGGVQYLEPLLKAYSGSTARVDRKSDGAIVIPDPALTIAVTVQPSVLQDLLRWHGPSKRGFVERFLFSVPEPLPARNQNPPGIDVLARREFRAIMQVLLDRPVMQSEADPGPPRLVIQNEAAEVLKTFSADIDQRSRTGDLSGMFEVASKQRENVTRIAGILHVYDAMFEAEPGSITPIPAETVERAVKIGQYFAEHAKIAYSAERTAVEDDMQYVVLKLREIGLPRVRRNVLHRRVQHRFPAMPLLEPVLQAMEARGMIRSVVTGRGSPGNNALELDVHPSLLT